MYAYAITAILRASKQALLILRKSQKRMHRSNYLRILQRVAVVRHRSGHHDVSVGPEFGGRILQRVSVLHQCYHHHGSVGPELRDVCHSA